MFVPYCRDCQDARGHVEGGLGQDFFEVEGAVVLVAVQVTLLSSCFQVFWEKSVFYGVHLSFLYKPTELVSLVPIIPRSISPCLFSPAIHKNMLLRRLIPVRRFSQLPKDSKQLTEVSPKSTAPVLKGLYQNVNSWFPKLIPRIARFTWLDLVVYSEIFFVGLMVYIHFIDA